MGAKRTIFAIAVSCCILGGVVASTARAIAHGSVKCTPVPIGSNWEETGPYAVYGIAFRDGVRMAVKNINAGGGFAVSGKKYCFKAIEVDARSDVATAVANARKLISDSKVAAVLGPAVDSETIKEQVVTNAFKTIMFGASSILDSALIGHAGAGGSAHYLFKTSSAATVREGATITAASKQLPGVKSVALLTVDDAAGSSIGASEAAWMKRVGWNVSTHISYPVGTTDWSSFLTRIKATQPDLLWINYIPNDELAILKQASTLGVAPRYGLFSVDPSSYLAAFPSGVSGATVFMSCNPLCPHPPQSKIPAPRRAIVSAFWKEWTASKYPYTPGTSTATLIYDFVYMLRNAMQKAGTVSNEGAIVSALEKQSYNGVLSAKLHFDRNHVAVHDWDVCLARETTVTCTQSAPPK